MKQYEDYWTLYCPTCFGEIRHIDHADSFEDDENHTKLNVVNNETGAGRTLSHRALLAAYGDVDKAINFLNYEGYAFLAKGKCPHCKQPVYIPNRFVWSG